MILSSTGVGIVLALKLKRKYEICRELIKLCDYLIVDLEYRITPINELLEKSLNNSSYLSFISNENVKHKSDVKSILNRDENEEISLFLYSLGKSDVKSQLKQIKGFENYIKMSEKKYVDEYEKYRKLYLSFGFFIGTIISLVLI